MFVKHVDNYIQSINLSNAHNRTQRKLIKLIMMAPIIDLQIEHFQLEIDIL